MKTLTKQFKYSVFFSISVLLMLLLFTSSSPVLVPFQSSELIVGDTVAKMDYYLELKGNVRQSKSINDKEEIRPIDSALIAVYSNDSLIIQVHTNKKGKCSFRIPLDKKFKVIVSKKGFTQKFFEVNTQVPLDKQNTYSFSFDIDLFEEVKGLDVSILKKPIAKVSFNLIMEQFAYDISYTSRINFELKKMYKAYYIYRQRYEDSLNLSNPQPVVAPRAIEQKK